jgi:hypothetical protein
MHSTYLTANSFEAIACQRAPMVDYVQRLEEHMVEQRFDDSDRLRCLVAEARQALEKVSLELSALAVDGLRPLPHGKLKRNRDFLETGERDDCFSFRPSAV